MEILINLRGMDRRWRGMPAGRRVNLGGPTHALRSVRSPQTVLQSQIVDIFREFQLVEGLGKDIPVAVISKGEKDARKRALRLGERIAAERTQGHAFMQQNRGEPAMGFVTFARLERIQDLGDSFWKYRGEEIRGFAIKRGRIAIGQANGIAIVSMDTKKLLRFIRHPKLAYVHTVDFHREIPNRVLVASSMTDRIFEIDIFKGEIIWEWNPWLNGYSQNALGLTMVAKGDPLQTGENVRMLEFEEAERKMRVGERVPEGQVWINVVDFEKTSAHYNILEKWQKTCVPNAAIYGERSSVILASLFVKGEVIEIDQETGEVSILISGLAKPHGPVAYNDGYIISDTCNGRVLVTDKKLKIMAVYDLSQMPLREGMEDRSIEWIQSAHQLTESLFTALDSRRNTVFVWDPQKRIYSRYPYNPDLALQAVRPLPEGII